MYFKDTQSSWSDPEKERWTTVKCIKICSANFHLHLSKNSNYSVECLSEKALFQHHLLQRHFYLLCLWSWSTESSAHSLSKTPTQWKQVNLPNHSVFPKVSGRAPAQQWAKRKGCATATPNASSFRKAQLHHSPRAFFLAVSSFCFSPISKASGLLCLFPFFSFSFFSSLRCSPERKKQTNKENKHPQAH